LKWATVRSLAIVLFKSFYRASRAGRRSPFSSPRSITAIDVALFIPIFIGAWYLISAVTGAIRAYLVTLTTQAVVSLPLLLTSAVIIAGILFELGNASGLASSEAVNWLPVSPREYVVASSLSLMFAYTPLLSLALAVVLPLAIQLGFASVIPSLLFLTAVGFFVGAVLVEAIRSVTSRVSVSVYRKHNRLGTIGRILVFIILFVLVDIAFQPAFLSLALSVIVNGISLVWFVPMVWPSVALAAELSSDLVRSALFLAMTVAFGIALFYLSAFLRSRYWSPFPITINASSSSVYVPQGGSFAWLDPTAYAIALKDLRSLTRRKEMARFLAIPVILVVVPLFSAVYGGGSPESSLGIFLIAEVSTMLPIMLSVISLGQEGQSITNVYMLPITPSELTRGKIFFPTLISGMAVAAALVLFQFLFPFTLDQLIILILALLFLVVTEVLVGLGTGARYPDFTLGPRARYVTMGGFIASFAVGVAATIIVLAPFALFLVGPSLFSASFGISYLTALGSTVAIGAIVLTVAWAYCTSGVKKFLSDMNH